MDVFLRTAVLATAGVLVGVLLLLLDRDELEAITRVVKSAAGNEEAVKSHPEVRYSLVMKGTCFICLDEPFTLRHVSF
jgi:hypothetical protein